MNPQAHRIDPLGQLTFELSKLPGIGSKTALRLAYYIIKQDSQYANALAQSILAAKNNTVLCSTCFNFTENSPCSLCSDANRNSHILCIVEKPSDASSIERAHAHGGRYHVLHGLLSPLDGIGPEELKVRDLILRLKKFPDIKETILALNPTIEGEATSLYISRLLQPLGIKTTRLAFGLPSGGQLEYTDQQTIQKAIENRMEIHS